MSLEAIAAVLHHSQATGTAKLILMGLAWHTNENAEDGCWPSQQTLANYANTTIRQVRRALNQLSDLGEIEVVNHGGEGSRFDRLTNRYFIRVDCSEGCLGGFQHIRPADIYGHTGGHLGSDERTFMV
jgi:hypothetical protein